MLVHNMYYSGLFMTLSFQNLVGSLERSWATMAEDLVNLLAQNETLKKKVETIPPLKQKLQVYTLYGSMRDRFQGIVSPYYKP